MARTFSISRFGLAASFLLTAAVLLLWFAYRPSFLGPFVFDDIPNLSPLGAYGQVDNLGNLARWLDSGDSGPLGRPLALLSFLIEDNTWPTDAGAYRRTNLLLHLLNAILVGLLMHRLVRLAERDDPARLSPALSPAWQMAVALAATAIWTCLPIQTAAVLLVVQRMTLLFSLFVLLALLAWLKGRDVLAAGATARGAGLAIRWRGDLRGTGRAGQGNGRDHSVPAAGPHPDAGPAERIGAGAPAGRGVHRSRLPGRRRGGWRPTGTSIGRPTRPGPSMSGIAFTRSPLILADYLRVAFIPRAVTLFHDDFPAFDPRHPTLLPSLALLTLILALALAWQIRKSRPVLAFSILFFVGGHLLEGRTESPGALFPAPQLPAADRAGARPDPGHRARPQGPSPLVAGALGLAYLGLCLLAVRESAGHLAERGGNIVAMGGRPPGIDPRFVDGRQLLWRARTTRKSHGLSGRL